VLDRRRVETGYGRQMLQALPPFKRTLESARRKAA
jgi:Rad3-related DNA helicase